MANSNLIDNNTLLTFNKIQQIKCFNGFYARNTLLVSECFYSTNPVPV